MGAGASLANVQNEVLTIDTAQKNNMKIPLVSGALTQNELLRTIQRKSFTKSTGRKLSQSRRRQSVKYDLPPSVVELLKKVGIDSDPRPSIPSPPATPRPAGTTSQSQNDQTSSMVTHIFECLGALQHLVRANQYGLDNNDCDETQSVSDRNLNSLGKLVHEMVNIYGLAGDTLKILLNANPGAANVEDEYGRRPIHIAVDREEPWIGLVRELVEACPEALKSRDGGGKLPLHVAVDNDSPNPDIVELLLKAYPDAASARRGVGRLPIHYAFFSKNPSLRVVQQLMTAYPEGASLTDVYGRLALHYAVDRSKPVFECVKLLIDLYPQGLFVRDNQQRLPLAISLEKETVSFSTVSYIVHKNPETLKSESGNRGYLPLHIALEHATPNISCIRLIARTFPEAVTKPANAGQAADADANETIPPTCPLAIAMNRRNNAAIRELLFACPAILPSRLRDLNWKARRVCFLLTMRGSEVSLVPSEEEDISEPMLPSTIIAMRGGGNFSKDTAGYDWKEGNGETFSEEGDEDEDEFYDEDQFTPKINFLQKLNKTNIDIWKLAIMYL